MKHQYVGDISDYRKYALLRALSAGGVNRIGVCWMLTPDDASSDGNKLAYLNQPDRHRHFDPVLFDMLVHAALEPDRRRLQTIEDSGAIAGAAYYNDMLPDDAAGRLAFMARCASEFRHAELVFFDPDNGLEVSLLKGCKNSSKYLYLDEVATFYEAGKSLLIYQHFPRIERKAFMASRLRQLTGPLPAALSGRSKLPTWCSSYWFIPKARRGWRSRRWKPAVNGDRVSFVANTYLAPCRSPPSPIIDGQFPVCFRFLLLSQWLGEIYMAKKLLASTALLLSVAALAACDRVDTESASFKSGDQSGYQRGYYAGATSVCRRLDETAPDIASDYRRRNFCY